MSLVRRRDDNSPAAVEVPRGFSDASQLPQESHTDRNFPAAHGVLSPKALDLIVRNGSDIVRAKVAKLKRVFSGFLNETDQFPLAAAQDQGNLSVFPRAENGDRCFDVGGSASVGRTIVTRTGRKARGDEKQ